MHNSAGLLFGIGCGGADYAFQVDRPAKVCEGDNCYKSAVQANYNEDENGRLLYVDAIYEENGVFTADNLDYVLTCAPDGFCSGVSTNGDKVKLQICEYKSCDDLSVE